MNLFLSVLLFLYKFNLFRRIVPSIIRKFYSKKNHEITINNFKITLNVGSSIDREIFLKKLSNGNYNNKINVIFHYGACSNTTNTNWEYLYKDKSK